jgi:hypothetical protein
VAQWSLPGGRRGAHGKDEGSTVFDLRVAEPGVGKIDAIKRSGLDVMVEARPIEILRDDPELLSVTEGKRRVRYARSADEIDILALIQFAENGDSSFLLATLLGTQWTALQ